MQIVPTTKSITEYTLTLSEQEAVAAVTDPYSLGERIAEQLLAAGIAAPDRVVARPKTRPTGFHKERDAHFRHNGKGPRKPKRPNLKAGKSTGNSLEPLQCPHCSKKIARKYLPLHLATKHPDSSPSTASTARGAVAPAAA